MILGLCGFARCGKDTAAEILVEDHGFQRIAFADALKQMVYDLDPLTVDGFGEPVSLQETVTELGWEGAKAMPDVRRLLQRFGTEVVRQHIGADLWVQLVEKKIAEAGWSKVVIPDCRFPNEIDWVRSCNGRIWRIDRPGIAAANAHTSEHAWGSVEPDRTISNTSTIDALRTQISRVFTTAAP